jgi:hypothetical protein
MEFVDRLTAVSELGVSERQFDRWRKEPGFPEDPDGFEVAAIRKWREAYQRKGSEGDALVGRVNLAIKNETLQEKQKKNRLLQIEIETKTRELVPTQLVHELLMELAGLLRGTSQQLQQNGHLEAAKLMELQIARFKKLVSDKLNTDKLNTDKLHTGKS